LPDSLFDGLDASVQREAPLAPRTWYRLGGPAQALVQPETPVALATLMHRCHGRGVPVRVLGDGANLLVPDAGVPGVVLRLDRPGFTGYDVKDGAKDGSTVRVGAGHDLFALVQRTARDGRGGLDALAGIPASLGGAVRMNAGGAYGDTGALVEAVHAVTDAGEQVTCRRDAIEFSYRRCSLTEPVFVAVDLRLPPEDPAAVKARVKEVFAYKKSTQPMGDDSCGCVFKNPAEADRPFPGATAGRLIDEAGLKGYAMGGASVSPVHANFVVVTPGGTAADVLGLLAHVERVVRDRFGVRLERELVCW
jgi:UDP-N-acetylmuramate dehydrogenase